MFFVGYLTMITFYLFLITQFLNPQMTLADFDSNNGSDKWYIVDDVVMGGRSKGTFQINEEGNGVFRGTVSLENYGGFSSIRHSPGVVDVESFEKIKIRLKGDGKNYQFRVKTNLYDRHSYIFTFQTTGAWETIEIPFGEMIPGFRGYRLNMPNYPGQKLEEIAFLIGNKKAEAFRLEIEEIILE